MSSTVSTLETIRSEATSLVNAPAQERFDGYFRLSRELADQCLLPELYADRLIERFCLLSQIRLARGVYPKALLDTVGHLLVAICDLQIRQLAVAAA